jgi:hypothetical protein
MGIRQEGIRRGYLDSKRKAPITWGLFIIEYTSTDWLS